MAADYPEAQAHFVPDNFMFNTNTHSAIVIHKTAGDATPQAIYNTFLASGNPGKSVHYGVGQDGTIWQYVPEAKGAGGNCCLEPGHDSFWDQFRGVNLNTVTISIEHCDPATDNSTPLTAAQKAASFRLVAYLARKYNIPASHIKTHASIDPQSRARCPGNYPFSELIAYVQQGGNAPAPQSNPHFDEEAADCWNSFFMQTLGEKAPPMGTGIFNDWKAGWLAGHQYGPPITPEYKSVNMAGEVITVQEFAHARAEHYGPGDTRWYSITKM